MLPYNAMGYRYLRVLQLGRAIGLSRTKSAVCPAPRCSTAFWPGLHHLGMMFLPLDSDFLEPITLSNKPNIYAGVAATARDWLG